MTLLVDLKIIALCIAAKRGRIPKIIAKFRQKMKFRMDIWVIVPRF